MTEDIRTLSAQYAADPSSLVFLRLGEALRQRAQLDAALTVSLGGLSRYPHLPDAHDLYARILTDRYDYASAFDEWDTVLRLAPNHLGAHKGLGFLCFRAGDHPTLTSYHRQAIGCRESDVPGQGPFVVLEDIGATPSHRLATPAQTSFQAVAPPPSVST